jgi:methyl-accepting chemotaxis protein
VKKCTFSLLHRTIYFNNSESTFAILEISGKKENTMRPILSAIKQFFSNLFTINSIRTRIILAFVGAILFAALVTSVSSIIIGITTGQQSAIDELGAIARLKETEINTWVNILQTDLEVFAAQETPLLRMRGLLRDSLLHELQARGLDEDFKQLLTLSPDFEEVMLLDLNGQILHSSTFGQQGKIYRDATFFQQGLEGPTLELLGYSLAEDKPATFVARPIHDEQGEILGVLAGRVAVERLNRIVRGQAIAENTQTYLVDAGKTLITQPPNSDFAPGQSVETLGIVSALNNETFGYGVYDDYRDMRVIGAFRWLPNLQAALLVERDRALALEPIFSSITISVVITIGAIVAAIIFLLFVMRGMFRQIDNMTTVFNRIGRGDYRARATAITNDELGTMAVSLNGMLDNTVTLIQSQEERDRIQSAVQRLLNEVSDVAQGDLTVEAEVTPDITGSIADAFNFMIIQLRNIISNVQGTTLEVSSAATEIQTTAEYLSTGSEAQATQIVNTSAAVEEIAVSIQQVSENATLSADVAHQALNNARQGTQAVQDTITGMNRIRDQVQETAKRIKRLGERSQEIGEIVQLIRDIAKRTSILALNASLEASTAGEAGRGFAVVAEDVKRLAERSSNATRQIAQLIQTIQNETNEAVAAMEEGTRQVVEGSKLADQAGQALAEIESVSGRLAELIQAISLASRQQARGSEDIARSMSEIAQVSQQTASGAQQAAVSISHLAALADNLRDSVSAFRLPNGNGRGA